MKEKTLLFFLISFSALFAQSKMYIHKADGSIFGVPLNASLKSSGNTLFINTGNAALQFQQSEVDSILFGQDSDTILVKYNENSVSILNPLALENVTVTVSGTNVIINSTSAVKNLNYKISGTTSNGQLKIYSNTKFNLIMNNLNLTNATGPAINIQSNNKTTIILSDGSENYLKDGASYPDSLANDNGLFEDQNAALFAKGDLAFNGNGSLTITGLGTDKYALYSKDEVSIATVTLIIKSAAKDGIHGKDGVKIESGIVNVNSTGDAIEADDGSIKIIGGSITTNTKAVLAHGITSSTTMNISNAEININIAGDESKGIKSGKLMTIDSGNITINTSGGVVLNALGSGYNPSYCSAIKSDSSITINGSNIIIKSTGKAGKGISADKDIVMTGGTINITTSGAGAVYKNSLGVTDSYHATCMNANGNIIILGGTLTTSSSGTAGRGISADGTLTIGDANNSPTLNLTTTGTKITVSGSGMNASSDEAKAISSNGAVTVNNGNITISSADDGIKSEISVTVNNGTISITKCVEGIESPIITINNGNVSVVSSDDSFNGTKGNGGEANDGSLLSLNGGNIVLNTSNGDGLDSNGSIQMTGGTVIVNGPTSQPEVGADYNGTFNISGGLLLISGPNSGNMIQATSTTSSQYTIKATTSTLLNSSTLFRIQDAAGNNLITYKPVRNVYYLVFSSPSLLNGSSYSIYTGGTSTGTYSNGIYVGGSYSGGTLKKTFTISSKVTAVTF